MDTTALVERDIEDLIPEFLANRRNDIELLREAIAESSFRRLEFLACRMYGVGNPYGFRQITTFGRELRDACARRDLLRAKRIVAQYETYLDKVKVRLVDAPPVRRQWQARGSDRRTAPKAEAVPESADRRKRDRRQRGSQPSPA